MSRAGTNVPTGFYVGPLRIDSVGELREQPGENDFAVKDATWGELKTAVHRLLWSCYQGNGTSYQAMQVANALEHLQRGTPAVRELAIHALLVLPPERRMAVVLSILG